MLERTLRETTLQSRVYRETKLRTSPMDIEILESLPEAETSRVNGLPTRLIGRLKEYVAENQYASTNTELRIRLYQQTPSNETALSFYNNKCDPISGEAFFRAAGKKIGKLLQAYLIKIGLIQR